MAIEPNRRRHWAKVRRNSVLLVVGIIGFVHEVFISTGDRTMIIAASLALMGLPFYLGADERRESRNGAGKEQQP